MTFGWSQSLYDVPEEFRRQTKMALYLLVNLTLLMMGKMRMKWSESRILSILWYKCNNYIQMNLHCFGSKFEFTGQETPAQSCVQKNILWPICLLYPKWSLEYRFVVCLAPIHVWRLKKAQFLALKMPIFVHHFIYFRLCIA